MSAQDQTIDQYQELMQLNAVSHVLRTAKQVGLLDGLRDGQRTLDQLRQELNLRSEPTRLLLATLVRTGIVEQYDDDFALAPVAQLLCQYDSDLGDGRWRQLADKIRGDDAAPFRARDHFDATAATQWVHTASAIQAAEILNIGGADEPRGPKILDLGCGSAVWSCAMAFRDVGATITAVDDEATQVAAANMAASIDLTRRFDFHPADPAEVAKLPMDQAAAEHPWAGETYDLVLLAQRLHAYDEATGDRLLQFATGLAAPGGRVVVIDLFASPAKPSLAETLEALRLEIETDGGRVWDLETSSQRAKRCGLTDVQFTFLAASRINLGMLVGVRAERTD
ncbi:methyltransferase domain-containing protein [Crateriforma conspicua]|uniref:methyltransferase domain-containing protein n=1 Tax=Crateriforma conspicua TaxID=2527996 RepID=UPI00119D6C5D|nr:class I SAM-dependent methyltransferase [Crateriforma conspicua]